MVARKTTLTVKSMLQMQMDRIALALRSLICDFSESTSIDAYHIHVAVEDVLLDTLVDAIAKASDAVDAVEPNLMAAH